MATETPFDGQIFDFVRVLEVCLRSGYSLAQALSIVSRDLPDPLAADAAAVVQAVEGGQSLTESLDDWLKRRPIHDLDLVLATIAVQREIGGNLADKLRLLGQVMAHRQLPQVAGR